MHFERYCVRSWQLGYALNFSHRKELVLFYWSETVRRDSGFH